MKISYTDRNSSIIRTALVSIFYLGYFNRIFLLALTLLAAASLTACAESFPPSNRKTEKFSTTPSPLTSADDARCGGRLEEQVWRLWDAQGRDILKRQLIDTRLLRQGDSYALYDIQGYFQSLEAMAERCQRTSRLVQLADDLIPVFDALTPLPYMSGGQAWVCRGGAFCNEHNKLIGREVVLNSAQGLGFLSALAEAMARSSDPKVRAHPFIRKTVQASIGHLQRWGDLIVQQNWRRLAKIRPQDIMDNSSALLLTDIHLWQIAIYANLAGIATYQSSLLREIDPTRTAQAQLAQGFGALLQLFQARLSLVTLNNSRLGRITVADLDRGYWRLYGDNLYAGYTGVTSPAVCRQSNNGVQVHLQIDARSIASVADLGWDFSHARRLVPVLDALDTNRQALQIWYDIASSDLPPDSLAQTFAAQLISVIWNGDTQAPLFSNYWNGANGWYRVAYDNGTGRCYEGYPPFGLSDSFVTGGYAAWNQYYPQIGELAHSIQIHSISSRNEDKDFIRRYYFGLSEAAPSNTRMLTQLMFWSSQIR